MTKKFILRVFIVFGFCIACATTNNASDAVPEKVFSVTYDNATISVPDNETLILYYSKMGTTRKVAKRIHALMPEAEFAEIKSSMGIMKAVFWHQPFNRNAKIEAIDVDFSRFKQIILCSPIWFQKISSPARTVINTMPLQGKRMHLIITCGGHFGEGAREKLRTLVASRKIEPVSLSIIKTGGKADEELHQQAEEALQAVLPNRQQAVK